MDSSNLLGKKSPLGVNGLRHAVGDTIYVNLVDSQLRRQTQTLQCRCLNKWWSIQPSHEIMVLSTTVNSLMFGRTLRLLPYFMCANSEGSGEGSLALAFDGRLCDKYHNLMSWLNWLHLPSVSARFVLQDHGTKWRTDGTSAWCGINLISSSIATIF